MNPLLNTVVMNGIFHAERPSEKYGGKERRRETEGREENAILLLLP